MARVKFLLLLCFTGLDAQHQGDQDLGALLGGLGGLDAGPPTKQGKGGARSSLCPSGETSVPKLDQHKKMIANGCGPEGMIIKEPYGLWRCCNSHDVCFSVCGTSHNFCEDQFASCMDEVCEQLPDQKRKECMSQASTFSTMTKLFGVGFHQASQNESCECAPKDEAKERRRQYLENFYNAYDQSMLDSLDEQVSEWRGKEAELHYDLVKKYGHLFVNFNDVPKEFDAIAKVDLKSEL
mmetsp:Transcript_1514/g.2666  ORF Transcript_1514/g.2666 Transcript_1514/m.2666 type:complete len:238 (+) Transcript_1514:47-760(+)